MSGNRRLDSRVERSAVLAVERSILDHTELVTASPAADFGVDLIVFRPAPFEAIPVQVKGAQSGFKVWRQYSLSPIVVAYVVEPLSEAPLISIMSGQEAWGLPREYIRRGGLASDHREDNGTYRWSSVTRLLRVMLEERAASPGRWAELYEQVRPR